MKILITINCLNFNLNFNLNFKKMSRKAADISTEKKPAKKNLKTEKIEDIEKNLKRKRDRSESNGTPQFNENNIQSNENSSIHQKSKSRIREERIEEINVKVERNNFGSENSQKSQNLEEDQNVNFESLSKKNLSYGKFLEQVQNDHSRFKNVFQKIENSIQSVNIKMNIESQNNIEENKFENTQSLPNNNLLSFSKDFALQKALREEAMRKSSLEENAGLINNSIANTNINLNNNDLAKKLSYESEEISNQDLYINEQPEIITENLNNNNINQSSSKIPSNVSKIFSPIPFKTSNTELPTASPSTLYFQNPNPRYPPPYLTNQATGSKSESKKSLPGSTKNIKEVLNIIDASPRITSNTNLSEIKNPLNISNRRNSAVNLNQEILNQSSRPVRRSSILSSNKNVLVILKQPSVSDFTQVEGNTNTDTFVNNITQSAKNLPVVNSIVKAFTYKDYAVIALYAIIGCGLVLVTYTLYQNGQLDNIWKNIIDFFNSLDVNVQYVILGLIASFFALLIYKKFSDRGYFERIAQEDYNKLVSLICDNHNYEPEPIGILENKFVSDTSKSYNMTEGKYRKNILPLIEKIIKDLNKIEQKEVLIQEQGVKVWDFKN
jgi:hypothetical protein